MAAPRTLENISHVGARRGRQLGVVGVTSALLVSLSGAAALAETPSAGLAPSDTPEIVKTAGADEPDRTPVTASGAAPVVSSLVTGVTAAYPLATNNNPAGARTITIAEAKAGTTWKDTKLSPQSCPDAGLGSEQGLTPAATVVLNCLHAAFPQVTTYYGVGYRASNSKSDHPAGRAVDAMIDTWQTPEGKAFGWEVAHFVEANAAALNVKYIIWNAQIYIPGSGWRAYHHPSGATDPNSMHLNHVHVSVRS